MHFRVSFCYYLYKLFEGTTRVEGQLHFIMSCRFAAAVAAAKLLHNFQIEEMTKIGHKSTYAALVGSTFAIKRRV